MTTKEIVQKEMKGFHGLFFYRASLWLTGKLKYPLLIAFGFFSGVGFNAMQVNDEKGMWAAAYFFFVFIGWIVLTAVDRIVIILKRNRRMDLCWHKNHEAMHPPLYEHEFIAILKEIGYGWAV